MNFQYSVCLARLCSWICMSVQPSLSFLIIISLLFVMVLVLAQQVSLSPSYTISYQLFFVHATLWLCIWYHGQIYRWTIWNFTQKGSRITRCSAPNSSNYAWVHLSSQTWFCLFGLQALHIKMVLLIDLACDIVVYDVKLVIWPYFHCREISF